MEFIKRLPIYLLYFLLVFFNLINQCFGKVEEEEISEKFQIIEYYLNRLEISQAKKEIQKENDPIFRKFYDMHADFLKAFVEQNNTSINYFYTSADRFEEYISQNKNHSQYYFMTAELYLNRTIIKVLQQRMVSALNDLRKCYNITQEARKKGKQSSIYRFSGIFFIAFSSVPRQFRWALDLFGLEGDLLKGYNEITIASQKGGLLHQENNLILYFVLRNLMSDVPKTKAHVTALYKSDPTNILYVYLYAHHNIDRKNNEESIMVMEKYANNHSCSHFPFIYNQLGRSYLFRQDYTKAILFFEKYLKQFHGIIYKTDANYRQGVCFALLKNKPESMKKMKLAATTTQVVFDEDKYAQKQANKYLQSYFTNNDLELIKARFWLDGGYHEQGKAILMQYYKPTKKIDGDELTEAHFRLGRMYDFLEDYSKAIYYYNLTIKSTPTSRLWMKVYSHLYAGNIHERLRNFKEANRQFKIALEFDSYDYQSGMEQKAKAGIQRVRPYIRTEK